MSPTGDRFVLDFRHGPLTGGTAFRATIAVMPAEAHPFVPLNFVREDPQRQLAVDATLARAARPLGAAQSALAWTETRPMVGPGPAVEHKPQPVAESGGA